MCAAGSAEKLRKYGQPWWQEGRALADNQGLGPPGNPAAWPLPNPLSGGIKLGVMVGWGLGGGPSASVCAGGPSIETTILF